MSEKNSNTDFWEWAEEHKEEIPTEVYLQLADLALQRFNEKNKSVYSTDYLTPHITVRRQVVSNETRTTPSHRFYQTIPNTSDDFWKWVEENKENLPTEVSDKLKLLKLKRQKKSLNIYVREVHLDFFNGIRMNVIYTCQAIIKKSNQVSFTI